MPTLQVRDVPEHIYEQLVARAKRERRSISQQAVVSLAEGLERSSIRGRSGAGWLSALRS